MTARILDGRAAAAAALEDVRAAVASRPGGMRAPVLAAVLVGDDPASQIYVRNKTRACAQAGIESRQETMPAGTTQAELEAQLGALSRDPGVDGILLQLPLAPPLDSRRALETID